MAWVVAVVIEVAGVRRYATAACEVEGGDAMVAAWVDALSPDAPQAVSVQVLDPSVPWSEVAGQVARRSPGARVYCSLDGGPLRLVLDGVVVDMSTTGEGGGAEITIGYADPAAPLWPDNAVIDTQTHPVAGFVEPSQAALGQRYPLIFGYPGERQFRGNALSPRPAVPVYVSDVPASPVGARYALHDGRLQLFQGDVIIGIVGESSINWATEDLTDPAVSGIAENLQGELYRWLNPVDADYPSNVQADEKFAVGFSSASGWAGGITRNGVTVTELPDVVAIVLQLAGLPISSTQPMELRDLRVDTYIDTDDDARSIVSSWLGSLSAELVRYPDGYGIRYMPDELDPTQASARVVCPADGEVVGSVERVPASSVRGITIRYAPRDGQYMEQRHIIADPLPGTRDVGDARCDPFGAEELVIDVPWTHDEATAYRAAKMRLSQRATAWQRCTVVMPPEQAHRYRRGQTITITDPDRGWARALARVEEVTARPSSVAVAIAVATR